jgi:hypothetical protein
VECNVLPQSNLECGQAEATQPTLLYLLFKGETTKLSIVFSHQCERRLSLAIEDGKDMFCPFNMGPEG